VVRDKVRLDHHHERYVIAQSTRWTYLATGRDEEQKSSNGGEKEHHDGCWGLFNDSGQILFEIVRRESVADLESIASKVQQAAKAHPLGPIEMTPAIPPISRYLLVYFRIRISSWSHCNPTRVRILRS
jgi:hypothetical protein